MAAITRQNIDIPVDIDGTLLVYNSQNLSQAVSVADSLRKKGIRVCMTSCNSEKTKEQYVEYAADSQLAMQYFFRTVQMQMFHLQNFWVLQYRLLM